MNNNNEIDMYGELCLTCGVGTFQETTQYDCMDGVLHCPACKTQINRWIELPLFP